MCEQDMDAADGAVAEIRETVLRGKRKRGEGLDDQPVRHLLWEQGSLEAYTEVLFGNLDADVEALQQRKAVYDEERRLSEGSDSCWSNAGSDSDSATEIEGGEEESATAKQTCKRKRGNELAQQPVGHSLWGQDSLGAQNEVLSGHLEGEVRALKQRKADYGEARRMSGSDSDGGSDNETTPELDIGAPALEGARVVAAQEGDLEEEGLGSL